MTCPECAGTLFATVVLGCGETVTVNCMHCCSGYNPPRGYVAQLTWEVRPESFTCREVSLDGDKVSWERLTRNGEHGSGPL